MDKIKNTTLPKGATKLIIHELRKAADNVNYAITETIDDALDAVHHAPNASIQITYDGEKLVVSDFGYGTGITKEVCKNIIEKFYSHHFANIGISKFGLGRNYPFATIPNHPNMTYETSIGDGIMRTVTSEIPDVDKEEWIKTFNVVL